MTAAVGAGVAVAVAAIVTAGVVSAVIVKKKCCIKGSSSQSKRFLFFTYLLFDKRYVPDASLYGKTG